MANIISRLICFGAVLLGTLPGTATAAPDAVTELRDSDRRVASIAFALLTANRSACPALQPATGLVLHSLSQYGAASRDRALSLWTFPSAVSVEAVVHGSPAERAGIQPGDGIELVTGFTQSQSPSHPTALRDAVESHIQSLPADAAIALTIKRNGALIPLTLAPVPACRSRVEVVAGSTVKARSDGTTIQIGQAFAAGLDDAELAFVISHELAHTIGQHRSRLGALENSKERTAKRERIRLARQFEDEADLIALLLMARAGWDPAAAPRFMRAKGRAYEPILKGGGAHRSAASRARLMEETLACEGRTGEASERSATCP